MTKVHTPTTLDQLSKGDTFRTSVGSPIYVVLTSKGARCPRYQLVSLTEHLPVPGMTYQGERDDTVQRVDFYVSSKP